ncbi:MAG: Ig-like domain-containing protein, partial [Burkholderiales bacterium]
ELDPALNTSANPAAFDMRTFAPKYFLINGKAYPDTAPIAATAPGNKLLLRYVNAGAKHHSMAVLGMRQNFVAKDGSLLPTLSHNVAAETLAPGQTGDAIATVPNVATESRYAVYDASLLLHNNGLPGFGGMLTFVTAGTAVAGTPGPTVTTLSLTGNALSATITAAAGKNVAAADYWVDSGAHTAITVTAGSPVTVIATIAAPASGSHVLYVRGQDDTTPTGVWGPPKALAFSTDTTGPDTSGLTLAPNPSNGSANVALHATANDSANGGSNIAAAEYTIDGGTAVAMTVNVAAPVASADATISVATVAGLSAGAHTVAVRSQDASGNWGAASTIMLTKIATTGGPVTSLVTAAPNPNNGALPLNSSQPVVRVTATMTSTGSTIVAAEGFVDSNPADTVRGFPFVPSDGQWNGAVEVGSADIPLGNIASLSTGPHTINVRGKDATGNWGATTAVTLVIDKTAPTVSAASATPSLTGSTPVTVSATATDSGCTPNICFVGGGEFYVDAAGAPGTGTAMVRAAAATTTTISGTISPAALAALSEGNHAIYVRSRDAAGNWSAGTVNTTMTIDRTPPTISVATLSPSTIAVGTASVTLNVTASDGTGSGVVARQYWIDGSATTPPASPTAFTGNSVVIPTNALTGGTHNVRVRVQDAAGNWSAVRNVVLYVVQAVSDARSIAANTSANPQTSDANANAGVLANDQPTGVAGRTAKLASAPARTSGTGVGTITVTCQGGNGNTAATPAITGNTVCTNGAYRVTLTPVGTTNAARQASKLGTYQFTYTETLNGVTSNATVTITVN